MILIQEKKIFNGASIVQYKLNRCFIFILPQLNLNKVFPKIPNRNQVKWISSSKNGERRAGLNGGEVPLLQVLTPLRLERNVVLHGLVPEEEMPVSPLAGGGGTGQDQLSYLSLRAAQLYRFIQSQDFVENCSRGNCHQICGERLDVGVGETDFSRGDKVQRKRKGRSGDLGPSLVISE